MELIYFAKQSKYKEILSQPIFLFKEKIWWMTVKDKSLI